MATINVPAPFDNNAYFQNVLFYQIPNVVVVNTSPIIPIPAGNDFIDYIFQFNDQGSFGRDTTINQLKSQGAFTAGIALLIYNPVEAVQGGIPAVGNSLVFPPQLAQSTVALPGFWVMITIKGGVIPQLEAHPNIQIINDRTLMFAFKNSVIYTKVDVSHINIVINSFGVYVRDGLKFGPLLLEDSASRLLLEDKLTPLGLEG